MMKHGMMLPDKATCNAYTDYCTPFLLSVRDKWMETATLRAQLSKVTIVALITDIYKALSRADSASPLNNKRL